MGPITDRSLAPALRNELDPLGTLPVHLSGVSLLCCTITGTLLWGLRLHTSHHSFAIDLVQSLSADCIGVKVSHPTTWNSRQKTLVSHAKERLHKPKLEAWSSMLHAHIAR